VRISGSWIRNCTNASDGGGIYRSGGANTEISNTTIENCTASSGGGIHSLGNIVGSNVTIENCTANDGGGIYSSGNISGFTIKTCTATRFGGGIYFNGSGNKEISNVTIENCTTGTNGGGIYSGLGSIEGSNVTIENCTATNSGGGIYSSGNISGFTIENCTAASFGGGIYCLGNISGLTVKNCTANTNGGGIYDNSNLNLSISNTIIKNSSANSSGGGLYRYFSSGKIVVTNNSRFENCRATSYGAIDTPSGVHEITSTTFINCTSRNDYKIFDAGTFAFIRNSTFTHDTGLVNMGSPSVTNVVSVFGHGGGGNFDTCTFNYLKGNMTGENYLFSKYTAYPNTGTGNGGSLSGSGDLTLRNCTFNFNTGSAGLLASSAGVDSTLLIDNCTINNPNNAGQQPLIWLNGNNPAGTFRFSVVNYYNGSLLSTQMAGLASSGLIRLAENATPVLP
jgi:parallel beta-helix repeat protein